MLCVSYGAESDTSTIRAQVIQKIDQIIIRNTQSNFQSRLVFLDFFVYILRRVFENFLPVQSGNSYYRNTIRKTRFSISVTMPVM
jgi:hypothetical protein